MAAIPRINVDGGEIKDVIMARSPSHSPTSSTRSSSSNSSGSSNSGALYTTSSLGHSVWSDYINLERHTLVQEYPGLDRKLLGGFISNVLMRIAQAADKGRVNDPDDEWHTSLLTELSCLREYHPPMFRVFADFVSRVLRRASSNGQLPPNSPYRPIHGRLPPIISLPEQPPSSAAVAAPHYGRSGTDPYLFSLESTTTSSSSSPPVRPEFSPYLTKPVSNRPPSYLAAVHPHVPSKRLAEEPLVKREEPEVRRLTDDKGPEGRTLACLRCRRKKTRCNHSRPTCSRCAHSGFKCEYPDPLPKPTDMATSIAKLQGQLQLLNSRIMAVEKKD